MNKQELFEKALSEFDEWPYDECGMIYCHNGYDRYKKGAFSSFDDEDDRDLNHNNWIFICTREEFEAAKAERGKKFTKEFVVRVGTNVPEVWQPCEILFEGEKFIVVKNESGREFSRRKSKIKIRDIDTRTDKEKAVDDILNELPAFIFADTMDIKTALQNAYDKWVGDKK